MISDGTRSLDITFLNGNMFRQVTMYWNSDIVINFLKFLYCIDWQPHLTCALILRMYFSMYLMCYFAAHVCRCSGDRKYCMCSN